MFSADTCHPIFVNVSKIASNMHKWLAIKVHAQTFTGLRLWLLETSTLELEGLGLGFPAPIQCCWDLRLVSAFLAVGLRSVGLKSFGPGRIRSCLVQDSWPVGCSSLLRSSLLTFEGVQSLGTHRFGVCRPLLLKGACTLVRFTAFLAPSGLGLLQPCPGFMFVVGASWPAKTSGSKGTYLLSVQPWLCVGLHCYIQANYCHHFQLQALRLLSSGLSI